MDRKRVWRKYLLDDKCTKWSSFQCCIVLVKAGVKGSLVDRAVGHIIVEG